MNTWSIGKSALVTDLGMCINHYRLSTVGLYACINVDIKINDHILTPDMIVMINRGEKKQCNPDFENNCFLGPPNFIMDVLEDPEKIETRKKIFSAAGVEEYLVLNENLTHIEWNRLKKHSFESVKPENGIIKSSSLPGLWIPIPALEKRDFWTVIACIDQGITRKEHHELMRTIWK